MGLEVAEISELPALRPIQTAAVTVSGALATAGAADDHDAAAVADAGCVTPTATCARAMAGPADEQGAATHGIGSATPTAGGTMAAPQPDGRADDTSYATPTTCRSTAPLDGEAACFTTPTSEGSALRPATVCPPAPAPAPRKLAPALKRKLAPLQQRLFYPVPRDLATVFKPAPTPAAKKMRAHAALDEFSSAPRAPSPPAGNGRHFSHQEENDRAGGHQLKRAARLRVAGE